MNKPSTIILAMILTWWSNFSALQLCARPPGNSEPDSTIYYSIRPIPLSDRTDLEISLHFKTSSDSAIIINLPEDYYGVPDLYKYVKTIHAKDGSIIKPTDKPHQRLVYPGKEREVSLTYLISYDPEILDAFSFAPNVSSKHFHVAGCQWMLPFGNISLKHKFQIDIIHAPVGWHFYSSISPNPGRMLTYDSYENLISTAIGGGEQPYIKLDIHGKPVSVFVAGKFNISTDKIFNAVKKIVSLQREWFNDDDFPFYNVTILPRTGIIAGTCVPNLFLCFIKQDISIDELNTLFSHEEFHTWLPNKIYIKLPQGESDLKYEWLYEGFADYFSRKILLDAGLISTQKFAELVNQDIINIADNPYQSASYNDLTELAKKGKFGTACKKLSYYRGALIALNWDKKIRDLDNGKQLKDMIRAMYDLASRNNGRIDEQGFFDIAASYKIDAKKDLDQFILQGLPITPGPDALGKKFNLVNTSVPSFDPGFSLEQTFKSGKVSGVIEDGSAYMAGLRNEMEFVDIQNSNRFGNGWSPDKPMTIKVKAGSIEKNIAYFPKGKPMKLRLYAPAK